MTTSHKDVYDKLPIMMYTVDADGTIVEVSDFWLERLKYTREQVLGRRSREFMAPLDEDKRSSVWDMLRRGEDVEAWDIRFRASDGDIIEGRLYGSPLLDGDGALTGAIAAVWDVTELKRAQAGQERAEKALLLAQKLEAVGQLAAGIAHEINTPTQYVGDNLAFLDDSLAAVLPALEAMETALKGSSRPSDEALQSIRGLLKDADVDFLRQELPAALHQSRDGVVQIKNIVLAMKEFSHPGQDGFEKIDLNRAIEATTIVARNEWKYVADLELKLDPALPDVTAVPSMINQVVLNLVVNAAHAIGDLVQSGKMNRGRIVVSTQQRDGHAVVLVEDNGGGIPPENLNRIFDPFFTTKKVGKGTGQGLAITHTVVVERHKGSIDVRSEVGRGTTFEVHLPLVGADQSEEDAA